MGINAHTICINPIIAVMLEALYNYISDIHPVGDEVINALDNSFEIIEIPKRHLLLREGQVCNYLYMVLEGTLRFYYIKDGDEVCSLFLTEKNLFNAPDSFYSRKPGYLFIESLEACKLARIHYDQLQQLYKTYPEINYIGRIITENYFVKSEERLYLLRKQSAEERYNYFINQYPSLLQRVPLKYIATYLGLTLETLSRVRAKMSR